MTSQQFEVTFEATAEVTPASTDQTSSTDKE